MTSNKHVFLLIACSTLLVAACEVPFLGAEQARIEAKREAEGRAVGSGCRYSGRSLEECYGMNPKMSKAAMFNGWRDMDGYMRENNIQVVLPEAPEAPEAPANKGENAKPTAADAAPAAEKPKAADGQPAPDKPKAAQAPAPAAVKQGVRIHRQPRRIA